MQLTHLSTQVLTYGHGDSPCSGQTLWGIASDENSTGLAWDWVQLQQGVVAMSDPFGMVTNLRLIDARGDVMSQAQAAMHLNPLVHSLPWQHEVRRVLKKPS